MWFMNRFLQTIEVQLLLFTLNGMLHALLKPETGIMNQDADR